MYAHLTQRKDQIIILGATSQQRPAVGEVRRSESAPVGYDTILI